MTHMDQNIIVDEIKKGMYGIIEKIGENTLDEISDYKYAINGHFTLLTQLTRIVEHTDVKSEGSSDTKEEIIQEDKQPSIVQREEEFSNVAVFERKLRGGMLKDTSVFIPEMVVRKHDMRNGDLVAYTLIDEKDGRHDFQVTERKNEKDPEWRLQFSYCPVKYDPMMSRYYVDEYMENGQTKVIKLDDVPQSLLISNEDQLEFKIAEGDLVDLAVNFNQHQYSRVIWKHETEGDAHITPKPSSYYKEESEKEADEEEEYDPSAIDVDLDGKKVLVVGGSARKPLYKHVIEEHGGMMIWTEGKEGKAKLDRLIQNVDVCALIIPFVSHTATETVRCLAKKNQVNVAFINTMGVTALLKGIEEAV